ncbi:MAG TPA: DNA primase [Myxococcaceae bacterium]|nr:DNA primase [Myxococcaceae bacterium]
MIPEHKIEEVRERVDIVALISRYVELKKAGRSYKGRCPFHQEKSPSFHVTPEMRRFKCFGCQAGGDAIAFVQRYLGKTFVDAVRDLAREAGVDIEAAQDPTAREKQELKEVTDVAFEHFKAKLADRDGGRRAREYVKSRGLTEEVAHAFGLGWAPLSWQDLTDVITKHGMLEWALRAGLVQQRARGDGYYDVFRGRLIIPIRAPEGRPIAFGGRLLEGEDGPKYLNSKESKLYNKSDTLYGMDLARDEIRRRKAAVLVEGYFDCIGMHQAGVKHAVALCSTALTPGHLALLGRCDAKELVLLLDGDEAGRKAVERLAGPLLAQGQATQVALLPEGEDPDTFARKVGVDGVLELLAQARPLTEHLFRTVLPQGKQASFEEKMKAVDRLKPLCAQLPVGLTRSAFFAALGDHSGLPAAELEATLKSKPPPARPPAVQPAPPRPGIPAARGPSTGPSTPPPAKPKPERPPDPAEAAWVAALLIDPQLITRDTYRVADELQHPGLRRVAAQISSKQPPEDALYDASEPVKRALEAAKRQMPGPGDALTQGFAALCQKLTLKRINEQMIHIQQVTGQISGANELTEEVQRLQIEFGELQALKKKVLAESQAVSPGTKQS